METNNTIKARHFKIVKGVFRINNKDYYWHIPKDLRHLDVKKGDMVLVSAQGRERKVIVVDVFREEIEETGKTYKPMLGKVQSADGGM